MTPECIATLDSAGIRWQELLTRFMNHDALMIKMLHLFPQDTSFAQLSKALDAQDVKAAFEAAHSLKGVAANLSIQPLFSLASEMTEQLRRGDIAGALQCFPALQASYEHTLTAISALPL